MKEPTTSEELMDMVNFIGNARTMGMIRLNEKIKESMARLQYLLDVYIFVPEDIELNKKVLTWPRKINPIFDQNDEVMRTHLRNQLHHD